MFGFGDNTDNQLGMMKENMHSGYPQRIELLKETIGQARASFWF